MESFCILGAEGILAPGGERKVGAGELLFFPTGPGHKLTNCSETGMLVYLDGATGEKADTAGLQNG